MMMGPLLKSKVEQDLKTHLSILGCDFLTHYSIDLEGIKPESEVLRRIDDGWCSEYSSVKIYDLNKNLICSGNISYVITDSREAIFWWEHLSLKDESSWKEICFYEYEFPIHIWSQLSECEKTRFQNLAETSSENVFKQDLLQFLQEHQQVIH